MGVYLARRLAATALTLLGVSVLVFGMVRLVPGTVVEQLLGQAAIASPDVVASFRAYFGLDRPVHVQYLHWLAGVLRGDFGVSWLSGKPVLSLFLERLPVSAELALLAVGWSLLVGVPLGTASAVWRSANRASRPVTRSCSTATAAGRNRECRMGRRFCGVPNSPVIRAMRVASVANSCRRLSWDS